MEATLADGLVNTERVHQVLLANLSKSTKARILPRFVGDTFEDIEKRFMLLSSEDEDWTGRSSQIRSCCERLFAATEDPSTHVTRLDECLSNTVECNFVLKEEETADVCNRVVELLKRLPPRPSRLPEKVDGISRRFFNFTECSGDRKHLSHASLAWEDLSVVSFFSTNVIRAVLLSVIYTNYMELTAAINVLAELLDMASEMSQYNMSEGDHHRWVIVRAFLWNTWQRLMMIMNESRLKLHVKFGYNHEDVKDNWIRPFSPCPGYSLREITDQNSMIGKDKSMCTWAFELLRSESICLGMDFTLFHTRYRSLFEDKPARCRVDSSEPCDGRHSNNCHRFVGMVVLNQAAHDGMCTGSKDEEKLVWDRSSYIAVKGARAVDIAATNGDGPLQYREASERTLAISHVWCHGQGGRPEDGINRCLHARYVRLAQTLGCDSYWMDTTCIPDQHQLRKEAVTQINDIFASSKVVLVCDRDLIEIDATNMTLELQESILAAILVCDWNIRAWTFLEAMKGRRNIHFLCRNDVIVKWRSLLRDVSERGRIDLAILSQLAPQLLPSGNTSREVLRTENVGNLLSYRPASRPGDDVVIWSLLANTGKPIYRALDFWKSQIGKTVLTGFLMSSATRLSEHCFSWAPASPYVAPRVDDAQSSQDFYRAFDGMGTEWASIEKSGLRASWWVYAFDASSAKTAAERARNTNPFGGEGRTAIELGKVRSRFLINYRFGALLQAMSITGFQHRGDDVGKYRGKTEGTLLVVCGMLRRQLTTSAEFRRNTPSFFSWTWKGVYDWPSNVPLPKFEKQIDFLIA
jgi:hypothetical protein